MFVLTNAIGGGSPAWQQLSPSGTPPIGRDQTPGAYDQAHNELLVFAGEGFDAAGDAITFNDSWILAGANGVTSAQVAVSQLFPNHGGNAGSITVQVIGSGFQGGATVKLTGFGSDIIATNVTVPNTSVLTAMFSLSGVAPGPGNVVVTNPDGTAATMVGGFTVESGGASKISVSILGRNALRLAFPQTFYLVLNDSGNLDASSFAASVGILATVSGLVPVVDAVADTYQSATVGEVDSFVVPSLPADSTQVIPFALTAPLGRRVLKSVGNTKSCQIQGQAL